MEENNIVILEDVFGEELVELLYISCKKQFTYNVLHNDDILVTNCILDCHGLALSSNVVFPYYENHWNIFCMTLKKIMYDYCDKVGFDKEHLVPHSCWGERSNQTIKKYKRMHKEELKKNCDEWLEDYLQINNLNKMRMIYYLKNPDPKYGTTLLIKDKFISIPGKENSLCIVTCGDNKFSNKFPVDTDNKYNLIFDWYIHPPESKNMPTWFLPTLDYKNNYREQISNWWYKKTTTTYD